MEIYKKLIAVHLCSNTFNGIICFLIQMESFCQQIIYFLEF